jgi:lipopolysaccharide transport system ATP-binding protein
MKPVIEVENLTKEYRIAVGGRSEYRTLRESLTDGVRGVARRLRPVDLGNGKIATAAVSRGETLRALDDVSFEVQPGEVVGVIGRNGAGKSTLLKILSRVTEPTSGRARICGRVGSLLEVGTGFHPELTGRENIYMNGSVLGMSRREIDRKYDEIVEFSGVERFLDTPVKRYSSGMQVRLAFAVAAHLEPESLIIDEVLTVGDLEFQKKCLGKMEQVSRAGRTVLFVSHNMAAVKKLCTRAVLLNQGHLVLCGDVNHVVRSYEGLAEEPISLRRSWSLDDAPGNDAIRLLDVGVQPASGLDLDIESGFIIRWAFHNFRERANIGSTVEIQNADGAIVVHDGAVITAARDSRAAVYEVEMHVPPLLNAGRYKLALIFGENRKFLLFRIDDVLAFDLPFTASHERYLPTPAILRSGFSCRAGVAGTLR